MRHQLTAQVLINAVLGKVESWYGYPVPPTLGCVWTAVIVHLTALRLTFGSKRAQWGIQQSDFSVATS